MHKNFGDALNVPIFNAILPKNFLNEDEEFWLLGIGSTIGLKHPDKKTKKVFVFSSGYAPGYGSIPELGKYEFLCVRGPKTAEWLRISSETAALDGAYLLPHVLSKILPDQPRKKRFKYTFVPHENKIPNESLYREFCTKAGINYLSPHVSVPKFIYEILESEVILAEAMHAAIVADALRIPWVPMSSQKGINAFKWQDFCASIDLSYEPTFQPYLFTRDDINKSIICRAEKFSVLKLIANSRIILEGAKSIKNFNFEARFLEQLRYASQRRPLLSNEKLVAAKTELILSKLEGFCKRFLHNP